MEIRKSQAKSRDFEISYVFWVCFEPLEVTAWGIRNQYISLRSKITSLCVCMCVLGDSDVDELQL